MKTPKFFFLALFVSAVLSAPAQAGNRRGGNASHVATTSARATTPTFHSASALRFSGGRMIGPSQRFSSVGMRSASTAFHQHYANSSASIGQRQFMPGALNRASTGAIGNRRGLDAGRGHVLARRSADWHRDWDRHGDHWWHGHRCRFVNGSWFIFDLGFVPWYGYPYDYYANDYYYPYGYGPGVYEATDADYYSQGPYNSSDQYTDSPVAAAQEQLARQGYYRGEIDGIVGPETRRAIARYQRDHGLRNTGRLTTDMLRSLGLE